MKKWPKIGSTELLFDGWRKVSLKKFKHPNGSIMEAQIFDNDGDQAAAIIALTDKNEVVVARQFRLGPEQIFEELPGGGVAKGEDPKLAAIRELAEETGYTAAKVSKLGEIYKHGWMASKWNYYLAKGCKLSGLGQNLDSHEDIEVRLISIDQLISNAKSGKMTDAEAVFLAYDELMRIKED